MSVRSTIKKMYKNRWLRWTGLLLGGSKILLVVAVLMVKAHLPAIEEEIHDSIQSKINGTVEIGAVDITFFNHFPHLSIRLENVKITRDDLYSTKEPPLAAEKMYLQLSTFKLIRHQVEFRAVSLENAKINLIKIGDGQFNYTRLFSGNPESSDSTHQTAMLIDRIYLDDVAMHYVNLQSEQQYDLTFQKSTMRISHNNAVSFVRTDDNIAIAGLLFNPENGSCFVNKSMETDLHFRWDRDQQMITIDTSKITIDNNELLVAGKLDLQETPRLQLSFITESIMMPTALEWLNDYTRLKLTGYDFKRPLSARFCIKGEMSGSKPMDMDLFFNTRENTFKTPVREFESVELAGHFYNYLNDTLPHDLSNTALEFSSFKATLEGIPFFMRMKAEHLDDPAINMHLHCDMPLTKANEALDSSVLVFNSGTLKLDADFKGNPRGKEEKQFDSLPSTIYGSAEIKDAACEMPHKNYAIKNLTASVQFNGSDMQVNNMHLALNDNLLNIEAGITNFAEALISSNGKILAHAKVSCLNFDLNNFSKPVAPINLNTEKKQIARVVSRILDNLEGTLSVNANSVTYNRLVVEKVHGNFILAGRYIACEDVSMQAAHGSLRLNGKIDRIGSASPSVTVNTDVTDADINTLFYQLSNFNQKAVTSENIQGSITAHANVGATLDEHFNIRPESLKGKMDFVVTNGALVNMSSLNEISKNVFRKKDLSNIQFTQLNNKTTISGQELYIETMEIQSNIIAMFVDGVYSFGDSTALYISVPVKSLRMKEEDYVAENKTPDEKTGMSIHLKATMVDGKFHVVPMLFHKSGSSKKNEVTMAGN